MIAWRKEAFEGGDMLPTEIDYSVFSTQDFANIILHRSDILHDVERPMRLIRAWSNGKADRLLEVAEDKGPLLAQRALADLAKEFDTLLDAFGEWTPRSIADLGCGYGFFGWYAGQIFKSDLLLIDLEAEDRRQIDGPSGTSMLPTARAFLTKNGIPDANIYTMDPEANADVEFEQVDLAVSLLGCGYHFPAEKYLAFFDQLVAPGGKIVLDLRKRNIRAQIETLSELGEVEIIDDSWSNRARIIISRSA